MEEKIKEEEEERREVPQMLRKEGENHKNLVEGFEYPPGN